MIEQLLAGHAHSASYFWRTQAGAELDLLLFVCGRRIGVEIKRADAPTMTPSMAAALHDLRLHHLFVVYPGSARYALQDNVDVVPLSGCIEELRALSGRRR